MSESSTFESWRDAVRGRLAAGSKPEVLWSEPTASTSGAQATLRLPKTLMALLQNLACFRDAARWEFMYRLAWRVLYENPQLLSDAADPDVVHAMSMDKAVRRDLHKMHAFVRFRELQGDDGEDSYFAWFEPQHEILRPGAGFFVRRFPNMRWTIATPDGAAVWDRQSLRFVDSKVKADQPDADSHEDLWRTYYRSICNVARINPAAMQREMPKLYWRNLPEAPEIANLMREGAARFASSHEQTDQHSFTAARSVQRSLAQAQTPEVGVQACRRCELWRQATQAVEGAGPATATLMLVGEQPGDEEDLKGAPFVGPAGRLLNELLVEAGIDRRELYVTNAVKHFKWEPRGKRRLHKRPTVGEIRACEVWLQREIESVRPRVIVALGASALNALAGRAASIDSARAQSLMHVSGSAIVASYHPSAILRAEPEQATAMRAALIEDLKSAARRCANPP